MRLLILLSFLFSFNSFAEFGWYVGETFEVKPCGQSGTIRERIKSCQEAYAEKCKENIYYCTDFHFGSHKWSLVSLRSDKLQIWYDFSGKMLWTDLSLYQMTWDRALDYCNTRVQAIMGMPKMFFQMPDKAALDTAQLHGAEAYAFQTLRLKGIIPSDYDGRKNLKSIMFWSSRKAKKKLLDDYAWIYTYNPSYLDSLGKRIYSPKDKLRAKCVGKIGNIDSEGYRGL